jgi:hypothetical protein
MRSKSRSVHCEKQRRSKDESEIRRRASFRSAFVLRPVRAFLKQNRTIEVKVEESMFLVLSQFMLHD